MKAGFALAAIAAACLSTVAAAQMGPGSDHRGMAPGMMGGQGMGPGMMGGQGMGPGMMGGPGGCVMGPGMMGGQGMGYGMMGRQGMGGGMMGGAGMMGMPGPVGLERLNLSDEQRGKVREVQRDMQRKQHALMASMREARWQAEDAARPGAFDEAAARKNFDSMAAIRKQMFEARLDAHKRMEGLLTKEQRVQLRQAPRSAGPAPRQAPSH